MVKSPLKLAFKSTADPERKIDFDANEEHVTISVLRWNRGHYINIPREEYLNLLRWQVALLTKDERKTLLNDMIDLELRNQ